MSKFIEYTDRFVGFEGVNPDLRFMHTNHTLAEITTENFMKPLIEGGKLVTAKDVIHTTYSAAPGDNDCQIFRPYFDGVGNVTLRPSWSSSTETTADELATTGASVNVSNDAPPTPGEALVALTPTTSEWSNILKDTSLVPSVNYGTRDLFDSSNVVSAIWQARQLYDAAGVISQGWHARILYGTSGALTSVNYGSRHLVNTAGSATVLDWGLQYLNDNVQVLSADWNARQLFDATGSTISVDYSNRQLLDSLGALSLDWAARATFNSFGQQTADWGAQLLQDTAGGTSIDWASRAQIDSSSFTAANWQNRTLYATDGTTVVLLWGTGLLNDLTGVLSANWNARQLSANDGATIKIDWSDPNDILFQSTSGIEFEIGQGAPGGVNWIEVHGAITGNSPIFTSVGSDTDVGMTFQTQGAGSIDFTSGITTLLLLANQAGAVNNFQMNIATTGNAPSLEVGGADTDIGMILQTKGAGLVSNSGAGMQVNTNLYLDSAANSIAGFVNLAAGTAVVANTSITANSIIVPVSQDATNTGTLSVVKNNGVGFTINSTINTDAGPVGYIVAQAA